MYFYKTLALVRIAWHFRSERPAKWRSTPEYVAENGKTISLPEGLDDYA